jgi:alkaline phosphatase
LNRKKIQLTTVTFAVIFSLILSAFNTNDAFAKKPEIKNVIIMISDGWGYNQVTATSYYRYGADSKQVYNRFPFKFAMTTFMDYQDTDHPC